MNTWSVTFNETSEISGETDKDHTHAGMYQILYIEEGAAILNISGQRYIAHKGTMVFINNIEMHNVQPTEFPYKRYVINISERFVQNINLSKELTSIFYFRSEGFSHCVDVLEMKDEFSDYFKRLVKENDCKTKCNDCYSDEAASSLIILLLITLFRKKSGNFPVPQKDTDSTMFLIKEYMDNNYSDEISIESIVSKFYLSQSYLNQNFKQLTGYSPKRYIMLRRIAVARFLLYNTEMPICDIVTKVGFSDTNNFIRYFKKETGQTPLQFRKSLRNITSSKN